MWITRLNKLFEIFLLSELNYYHNYLALWGIGVVINDVYAGATTLEIFGNICGNLLVFGGYDKELLRMVEPALKHCHNRATD